MAHCAPHTRLSRNVYRHSFEPYGRGKGARHAPDLTLVCMPSRGPLVSSLGLITPTRVDLSHTPNPMLHTNSHPPNPTHPDTPRHITLQAARGGRPRRKGAGADVSPPGGTAPASGGEL